MMKKFQLDAKGMACPMPVVQTRKLLMEHDVVETTVDNFTATQNLEKLAAQTGYDIEVVEVSNAEYVVTIRKELAAAHTVVDTLSDSCVVPVTQARRILETETKVEILVNDEIHVEKLHDFAAKQGYTFSVEEKGEAFSIVIEKEAETTLAQEVVAVKDDSYIVVINKKIMGHGSEELGSRLMKAYLYALTEQEVLPKKIIFYNDGGVLVDKNRSHVLAELRELEDAGVEIVCCGACIDYHEIDLAVGNATNMYFIVEDMRKANKIIRP